MKEEKHIDIDISKQQLTLFDGEKILSLYAISTAKNGTGQQNGSECTPLGQHTINSKIGFDAKENSVFIGREETGEIFSETLRENNPDRDWILTRILWLNGEEEGINKGAEVDTFSRYIYIHGCPDNDSFSSPSSHGCVKMHNQDIMELFEIINIGARVFIH